MAESDVERTVSQPDRLHPGKKSGTIKFIRSLYGRQHEVVAKRLEEQNAWLVLSVWVRGEEDHNWVADIFTGFFRVLSWLSKTLWRVIKK